MYRILLAAAVLLSFTQKIAAQAPVFAHPIQDVNVCANTTSTVFTAEYTPYPAAVIWEVSADNGSTWQSVTLSSIYTYIDNHILQITNPPLSMNHYRYHAVASNGGGTTISGAGTLYVNTGAPNTPVFVNPPTEACWGNTQRYYLTGGLEGDTIVWSVDGYTIYDKVTFNDTSMLMNVRSEGSASSIHVYADNGCGRSLSILPVHINPLQNSLPLTGAGTTCVDMEAEKIFTNIFSNETCNPVCSISSNTNSDVTGPVHACVTVDPSVQFYNGVPYVQRHYNIEPQNNASTATGTITLYFTQADFDAYNAVRGSNLRLPMFPGDDGAFGGIRITQFHGTGTTPGTYTGTTDEIDPDDNLIVYNQDIFFNDGGNRWEITFDVTGFSGFFLSTGSLIPLPLTLTDFSGQTIDNNNLLKWTTSQEQNTAYFEVQRNLGNGFIEIAKVPAAGNSHLPLHYQYTDNIESPASYRLKMVDLDGAATYSKTITLGQPGIYANSIQVSPNPLHASGTVTITAAVAGRSTLLVTDTRGRQLYQQQLNLTKGINTLPATMVSSLPAGTYLFTVLMEKQRYTTKFVRY